MEHNRVFRITEEDIYTLRDQTRDQPMIDAYSSWVNRSNELDLLIRKIEDAFAGVTLGDGIGLLEANGLAYYSAEDELAELRSRDERADWRRIDVETLNRCYAAPTFMNASGFVFHLPAFLIAELNDQFGYGFIDRLFETNRLPDNWMPLLNDAQREAIIAVLSMVVDHPDYCEHRDEITMATTRLREGRGITITLSTMTNADWPFDQPPDCAVITLRSIVFGGGPILHVTHDEDDHGWQFLGAGDADEKDAAVVGLKEIVQLDPSVLEVADMPPGWHAWRASKSSPWERARRQGMVDI
jgi:hypothetical protein